jgi:hypothetical protein
MIRRNEQTLQESLDWIRRNPSATNQEVPPDLRDRWMFESSEEPTVSGFHLAIFTFGYCQRRLGGKNGQKLKIAATQILELFHMWQMKLGLAEINEKTALKSAPLALYDFPADEKIEYWHED